MIGTVLRGRRRPVTWGVPAAAASSLGMMTVYGLEPRSYSSVNPPTTA